MRGNLVLILALAVLLTLSANAMDKRYPYGESISVDSPSDHIKIEDLHVFSDKAIINKKLNWARIEDTHSMEPVLNKNSISLEIEPLIYEIDVGDIISYKHEGLIIIHRVVSIGDDGEWFAITKGDNNLEIDPYKVRFENVKGLVVGILY